MSTVKVKLCVLGRVDWVTWFVQGFNVGLLLYIHLLKTASFLYICLGVLHVPFVPQIRHMLIVPSVEMKQNSTQSITFPIKPCTIPSHLYRHRSS